MNPQICPLKEKSHDENGCPGSLGCLLFDCMKKFTNKVFQYLADIGETETYGQVLRRCVRTALKLKEKGLSRDDIISSCTHYDKNTVVPLIASLFLRIKTAHFDPNLSHWDTVHLLKLIKPKIIFVALESLSFMERCLKESNVDTELVVFGETENYSNFSEYLEPNSEEDEFCPVVIDNIKETAIILFSSGTTGLPKGICLSHYGLINQISRREYGFRPTHENNTLLFYTTLYWISAVYYVLKCAIKGGARVVCSKFDPVDTWKLIEKYKVSYIFLTPYHARAVIAARQKHVDISSLNCFLTSSAPVTVKLMEDLWKAFPTAPIVQGYGQTEACGMISCFNSNNSKDLELQKRKPLSCGKVLAGYNWKVVDPDTDQILGPNQRGELRYKIDFQMNGYYKIDSSSAYDSEGYIKSGDIAYYDEEDCLFIVDRIKEMFKYKGWHILPAVLEGVLLSHPAVKEAVVIGIPHELDGEHPMGIVVLNKGYEDVTPEDLESYVEQIVPDVQRLRAGVKFVKEIARTTTSKVKRKTMRTMVLNGEI